MTESIELSQTIPKKVNEMEHFPKKANEIEDFPKGVSIYIKSVD